jgi:hypothetical protein
MNYEDLSVRAKNIIHIVFEEKLSKIDYISFISCLREKRYNDIKPLFNKIKEVDFLKESNCGRKTIKEISDFCNDGFKKYNYFDEESNLVEISKAIDLLQINGYVVGKKL